MKLAMQKVAMNLSEVVGCVELTLCVTMVALLESLFASADVVSTRNLFLKLSVILSRG